MTEDLRQREIVELAKVKRRMQTQIEKLLPIGIFLWVRLNDTTHKSIPTSTDIPDVVSLPPRRRGKKENIPSEAIKCLGVVFLSRVLLNL